MENSRHISILHINTHDAAGGASAVAQMLMSPGGRNNWSTSMLVGRKMSDDGNVTLIKDRQLDCGDKYARRGGLYYDIFSTFKIENLSQFQQADIIHLHNLHGDYFNPFALVAISNLKPVIWTLHDMQSLTGHCAHSFDCEKFKTGCSGCPYLKVEPAIGVDAAATLWQDKKLIYENSNLNIVVPSKWLGDKVSQGILKDKPLEVIYNGIDTEIFKPSDKREIRRRLNIPVNAVVLAFSANGGVNSQWRDGQCLADTMKYLTEKKLPVVFLNIGAANNDFNMPGTINVGHIKDKKTMAALYSAADILLFPSLADNCPLAVMEAMACNCPVVAYNTGGIPEIVEHKKSGIIVDYKDRAAFIKMAEFLCGSGQAVNMLSSFARERILNNFSKDIMLDKYGRLYENILQRPADNRRTLISADVEIGREKIQVKATDEMFSRCDYLKSFKQPESVCDVSVVLCTMNRAELLDKMLASIPAAAAGINYEIIAVVGQCSDNTLEILKKHNVTKIYNERECVGDGRHSWPMLYNFAFSKAAGKWAMFASDDIIFGENCLANAVGALNTQPGNVAGGIFFYKNMHERPRPNPFDNNKFFVAMGYEFNILMNYGLLRLDYFRQVGGFDENYNFYYADSDLCNKLYSIGKILLPLPASLVAHNDILDNLKKSNFEKLEQDVALYRGKWGKYYVDENNRPNRLVWQKEFVADYIPQITDQTTLTAVNSYWQGLSFFQRNMYSQAKEQFAEAINDGLSDPKVHDYLNKCASVKNKSKNISGIVFSKDRALQLDAAIRSFHNCCKDRIKLQVLYKASNQLYKSQYEKLKTRFNDVIFVEQGDFKNDCLRLLNGSEYVLFAVDDNIFVSDFSVEKIADVLYAQNDCLGFSLRLGKNTTYCYSKNAPQKLPAFERIETGVLKYDWTEAQLDFNYPLEVSSSIYKVRDILPLIEQLRFDNPNELEGLMALNAKIYIPAGKNLLCFEKSKTFCNPLNMVQTAIPNRASDRKDYSPLALAELFEKGMAIDIGRYFGFVPNACHQEVELYLKKSSCLSKTPAVSVEMVAYNAEQYIAQAIESVLRQSFADFELLIVDDGSDDKTECIVKSFGDARIRYIRQDHKGLAAGRNLAVTSAAGKYIVCVDSDDFIAVDYLRNIFEYAENNPGFDYYYPAKLTLVDGQGGLIGGDWEYNDFPDSRILPAVLFANGFSPIPIVGSLITKAMFERIGLYEDCGIFEDFVFLCKNALKMKFNRFQSNPAYFYRRLPQSASQKSEIRDKTISNMLNQMIAMYPPEVICPQLVNISDPSAVKIQYYKYVSDIFYRHAAGFHFVKFGQYFRRFGDFYKGKFLAAQSRLCVEPRSLAGRV